MKLWTREYGDELLAEKKPAILFLHGLFGDGGNLKQLIDLLSDSYYCVAVDLRNHGRSPHASEMSFADIAQDIANLLIFNESKQIILVGHSLGGKVAMHLSAQHTQKISACIVIDIAPVKYSPQHRVIISGLKAVALSRYKIRQEAERLLSEYVNDNNVSAFLLKSLRRNSDGIYDWRFNLPAIDDSYSQLCGAIEVYSLKPILFIKGENSNYLNDESENNIYKKFPYASIKNIKNAGHWPHIEEPEKVGSIVISFLDGLD